MNQDESDGRAPEAKITVTRLNAYFNKFHAIHDMTTSAQGGARYAGVLAGGGGLYAQQIVTRMRYDMDRAKQMAFDAMGFSPEDY